MSCVLRLSGTDLDIKALLALTKFRPEQVFQKGLPRSEGKSKGKVHDSFGANFLISDADFSQFHQQVRDAVKFFKDNNDQLLKLCTFAGVEESVADFGVEFDQKKFTYSFSFPNKLLVLAGPLSISLELSVYPILKDQHS